MDHTSCRSKGRALESRLESSRLVDTRLSRLSRLESTVDCRACEDPRTVILLMSVPLVNSSIGSLEVMARSIAYSTEGWLPAPEATSGSESRRAELRLDMANTGSQGDAHADPVSLHRIVVVGAGFGCNLRVAALFSDDQIAVPYIEVAAVEFSGRGSPEMSLKLRERKVVAFATPLIGARSLRFTCDSAPRDGSDALASIVLIGTGGAAAAPSTKSTSVDERFAPVLARQRRQRRGRIHWRREHEALSENESVLSRLGLSEALLRSPFDEERAPLAAARLAVRMHSATQHQVVALRRRQKHLAADGDFDGAVRVRDAVRALEALGEEMLAIEERYQLALMAGSVAVAKGAEEAIGVCEARCDAIVASVEPGRLLRPPLAAAPVPIVLAHTAAIPRSSGGAGRHSAMRMRLAQAKQLASQRRVL